VKIIEAKVPYKLKIYEGGKHYDSVHFIFVEKLRNNIESGILHISPAFALACQ
jgi:hypothetical protein